MEEITPATGFMKKTVIAIVVLVAIAAVAVVVFANPSNADGTCEAPAETVAPADLSADQNPF